MRSETSTGPEKLRQVLADVFVANMVYPPEEACQPDGSISASYDTQLTECINTLACLFAELGQGHTMIMKLDTDPSGTPVAINVAMIITTPTALRTHDQAISIPDNACVCTTYTIITSPS